VIFYEWSLCVYQIHFHRYIRFRWLLKTSPSCVVKKTVAVKRISRLVGEAATSSNVLLPHKAQNKAGWVSSRNSSGGHAPKRDLSAYQDYDERFLACDKIGKTFLSLTEYASLKELSKWHKD
jgi:hypothetical protein